MRVIAIDWSGAKAGASKKIWLGEVVDRTLVRLESGRGREEVCDHLIELAATERELVIGFDFAFSLPAWFLLERAIATAPDLWQLAETEAELWLASRAPPFWGGGRGGRPDLPEHFRRTDIGMPRIRGIAPKSVFQVGGAGSVGTGSLRGWPLLHRLRGAGFSVWPFQPVALPLVLEIYPRLLTGSINKSSKAAREAYLLQKLPGLDESQMQAAASNDDAFDATVSAFAMSAAVQQILDLPAASDPNDLVEGAIWHPGLSFQVPGL